MSIKGPEDIGISKATFLTGSLGVFGAGLMYGVYRVTKKEKGSISLKSQKPEIMLAARALGWGTALCLGTFAVSGAVFSYTTKVTSLNQFDVWARKVGLSVPLPKAPDTPETRAESQEIEDDLNKFVESIVNGTPLTSSSTTETDSVEHSGEQQQTKEQLDALEMERKLQAKTESLMRRIDSVKEFGDKISQGVRDSWNKVIGKEGEKK